MDFQAVLSDIEREIKPYLGRGKVADYIPALAQIDPLQFSMAITTNSGSFFGAGNVDKRFSIQSISKVYSYSLAFRADPAHLCRRVWREPSGNPFNSLIQLEYEAGIPRNPFINAGAIVVTDSLISHYGNGIRALEKLLDFIRETADAPDITTDHKIALSEFQHGYRNISLATLMKSFGNIHNEVDQVVETYSQQCSVAMSVRELSRSMLFLANRGKDPVSGKHYVSNIQSQQINSLMLTCGHYNASGDFAFRVGLPGKSGVGGGIVAIVPGQMAIAVFSPALNDCGNSLVGTQALELFAAKTGISVF